MSHFLGNQSIAYKKQVYTKLCICIFGANVGKMIRKLGLKKPISPDKYYGRFFSRIVTHTWVT